MAITLTDLQNKVMNYLIKKRSPADAAAISKNFIISRSKASLVLFQLHEIGLTDVISIGNKKFYKIKD